MNHEVIPSHFGPWSLVKWHNWQKQLSGRS